MSTKYLGGVKESFVNSVGTELCWGWSPAFDFMSLLDGRVPPTRQLVEVEKAEDSEVGKNRKASASCSSSSSTNSSKKKTKVVGFDEFGFPILGEDQDELKKASSSPASIVPSSSSSTSKPINILLAGAADVRHIIMTLARIKRTELGRSRRPLHFYIFEPSLRVHCRHLLFLQLLLVDLVTLAELEDRVSTVLEIFGNSLLREVSAGVLKNAALAVCSALECEDGDGDCDGDGDYCEVGSSSSSTVKPQINGEHKVNKPDGDHDHDDDGNNDDGDANFIENRGEKGKSSTASTTRATKQSKKSSKENTRLAGWLDWGNMKAKERDFIAQQILLWTKNRSDVDIVAQWDSRVRQELAERYDNRVNIFDWDFNFHILDYSQVVRFPEYREFRKIGQAFDYCRINPRRGFRYDYTVPNKSLAQFHPRTARGSYLGDVKNGPFFAIGQDTENPHLKKREVDGTTIYGCGVIAMTNIRAWLYELLTGNPFPVDLPHKHAWEDDKHYNTLPSNSPEPHIGFEPEVAPCSFKMVGLDIEKFLERVARNNNNNNRHRETKRGDAETEIVKAGGEDQTEAENESEGFFDAVFVGSTCTQWMGLENFFRCVNRKHGVVVAETLKFVVDAKDEAKAEFEAKIVNTFAAPKGWELNEKLTVSLHVHQLAPKERPAGVELDASSQKAKLRQKMNHAVVLTAKK